MSGNGQVVVVERLSVGMEYFVCLLLIAGETSSRALLWGSVNGKEGERKERRSEGGKLLVKVK